MDDLKKQLLKVKQLKSTKIAEIAEIDVEIQTLVSEINNKEKEETLNYLNNLDMVETYVAHCRRSTDRCWVINPIHVSKMRFPTKFMNSKNIEIYEGYHGLTGTIDNYEMTQGEAIFWKSMHEKAEKSTVREWSKAETESMPFIVYKSDP